MENFLDGSFEIEATTTVEIDGYKCFVVDCDVSKGDRRSDGGKMANFFNVEESATLINNVRESNRVKKRKDLDYEAFEKEALAKSKLAFDAQALYMSVNEGICVKEGEKESEVVSEEVSLKKKKRKAKIVENKDDRGSIDQALRSLRPPESGIRCAGRSNTTRLLWLHEFYVVHEGPRRKPVKYIYQALQFLLGEHLPDGEVEHMTEKMRRSIWVLGICHIPADHISHSTLRKKGYSFHTELHDEDAKTALFGNCPEVVRVDNCLKWHEMKHVLTDIPRVVHQEDVHNRRVHVAGRAHHYVCGVAGVQNKKTLTYTLTPLGRRGFCTYPEERLGMELHSPTAMWQHVDDIFTKIRLCMSAGRQGTSSATMTMPLLCTVYHFWQVRLPC
jgi:hypothetical protein